MVKLGRIIIGVFFLLLVCFNVESHENDYYKHSKVGPCYGWKLLPSGHKLCYKNKEKTKCCLVVFSHGIFHVSKEFPCPVEKENKKTKKDSGELNV